MLLYLLPTQLISPQLSRWHQSARTVNEDDAQLRTAPPTQLDSVSFIRRQREPRHVPRRNEMARNIVHVTGASISRPARQAL